jgi:Flp pilus assembly protein CpaB
VENITSSKLFRTRQGTLVLGVVAAVLAAIALIAYLNHYRSSVNSGTVPVAVLVAKPLIPKGTAGETVGSKGLYQVTNIPQKEVQAGAFTTPASLTGRVALKDIYPGQQLTESDFGSAPTGLTGQLGKGQRAVVVALDSPSQVGGQISTGDYVDVWALVNVQRGGQTVPVAHEILQKMYVLNSASGGNVTLRATPRQAGELIFASQNDKVWFVLRPAIGTVTRPPVITTNNLLGS